MLFEEVLKRRWRSGCDRPHERVDTFSDHRYCIYFVVLAFRLRERIIIRSDLIVCCLEEGSQG